MVYFPTFTININHSWIGKYAKNKGPMGLNLPVVFVCSTTSTEHKLPDHLVCACRWADSCDSNGLMASDGYIEYDLLCFC